MAPSRVKSALGRDGHDLNAGCNAV